ncbi:LacI family DNA-binding transcriptional regulator [Clavibacter capsici]|uniref:LacI family transcriptional regulator n=1 Tax=Clavibacter capsici TaxID=1874630 RepID=A0A0M4GY55_9MICO|nr:LacI family DNA-binding transcriptional regulator [Clavibacter capsici]ALD11624.1 LacI family transcriptional regulator [Clavibacter capsici]QIS37989.1 LacI family transcriptional regulator [Clavibacter capsici]QIS40727.1 LacI family transcriptional regulator [Clavibacter capsici]QIS43672.1 LacI family transcriptional regulator [Clavibacter capsici]
MSRPGAAPTIHDVAARAGVSKSVVSRALSGAPGVAAATQRTVREAAAELGYVANAHARGMSAHRTHTLGVLVRDASTPFYGHLLTALQQRASERGYRVVTATGFGSFDVAEERKALETLVSLQVEGLIVCSGALPVDDILPSAQRIPTVVAGRPEVDASLSSVYCDETTGGHGLAEHVAALGHRRVAVVTLTPALSLTISARTFAMLDRLRELGLDVVHVRGEEHADGHIDGADEVAQAIVDAGGVTAVMAPSDTWALAILDGLGRRGVRAPDDVSITGYDGLPPFTSELLGFTSWRQPIPVIGALAVDAVVDRIDGTVSGTRHTAVDGELIPGRTAVPLRA